jgi:hypothetical protein
MSTTEWICPQPQAQPAASSQNQKPDDTELLLMGFQISLR